MPTLPPATTPMPDAPDPNNRSTFDTLAYPWAAAQNTLRTELVALANNVYGNATEAHAEALAAAASATSAATAESIALAAANFKGTWASRVGAAAVPYSVSHLGKFWMLLTNVADVTAVVPGTAPEWLEIGATAPRWIVKTYLDSPFNMVSGEFYKIDSSGGPPVGVLPATMAANDRIVVMDLRGTFAINNFTVSRNGHNVDGVADPEGIICDQANEQREITYHDVTTGVTVR